MEGGPGDAGHRFRFAKHTDDHRFPLSQRAQRTQRAVSRMPVSSLQQCFNDPHGLARCDDMNRSIFLQAKKMFVSGDD